MKNYLILVAVLFLCTQAIAFKSENVERLRNTGSCENCDLCNFQFPERVNLERASLRGANLTGANLDSANLSGADLTGVIGFKRF
jgi:hypothetical protein